MQFVLSRSLLCLGLVLGTLLVVRAEPTHTFLRRRQLGAPSSCRKYNQVQAPQCNHCNHGGCGFGHCSAFTTWHDCESLGYGWETCGYQKCVGGIGCAEKKWCGRHCDPNHKTPVGVSDVRYSTNPATWSIKPDTTSGKGTATYYGSNEGSTPQKTGSIAFTVEETQTSSLSFSEGTTISTQFSAALPFISGGGLKVKASETIELGKGYSTSNKLATTVNAGGLALAPRSRQQLQFIYELQQYQIPFTAKVEFRTDCKTTKYQQIGGVATVSGVANIANGHAKWVIGPSVPWKCKSPFGVPFDQQATYDFCPKDPSDQCTLNVMCNADVIGTDCGCTGDKPLPCCSTARAHPNCKSFSPDAVICPDSHGTFNACCSASA